ncbi:hypothetical protein BD324DRAFT_629285 [Kockovaella imperatae]|uniref:Uncharacterized protein n=1 Tax=Kockovaella imperatae TaxID=4999 RepID=A0A1Y1UEA2_9TREE|nr:hypothetical protein BD324DRAFT_629285 [Kockovaella imperatae]ORX35857.1 hypothetical protein BD324DRAFT_629285 [Kockovaella imperatae]
MEAVIYNGDTRYPGPKVHPPPAHIKGIPTQAELDAFPRMFTWGELKAIVRSGDLEQLMRNKALQARYIEWMTGQKARYGSTEQYLTRARLPWNAPTDPAFEPSGTYDISSSPTQTAGLVMPTPADIKNLTISTDPDKLLTKKALDQLDASHVATPGSGTSTPTSAGFVSLASLQLVNGKLKKSRSIRSNTSSHRATPVATPVVHQRSRFATEDSGPVPYETDHEEGINTSNDDEEEADEVPVYLKWDEKQGLDSEKFAVLPNDWPYNTPYGSRHYCVWSRVPIAHPELVDYDPKAWAQIEEQGLGGFTGVTPLRPFTGQVPMTPAMASAAGNSSKLFSYPSPADPGDPGRKSIGKLENRDWYAADVAFAGKDMREWAGVTYESRGGKEVGKMVAGLWDPRGWECLWFVNPPRLQSVPGFSHFHVFARRKTPEEIDAAESF